MSSRVCPVVGHLFATLVVVIVVIAVVINDIIVLINHCAQFEFDPSPSAETKLIQPEAKKLKSELGRRFAWHTLRTYASEL